MGKRKERIGKTGNKPKHSKKVVILLIIIMCIAIGRVVYLKINNGNSSSEKKIATQSVKIFSETINLYQNRYSGIVAPENTVKIKKKYDYKIKENYVSKGDSVIVGQKLFEYDTSEIVSKIDQAKLDIEQMNVAISNLKKQIQNLNEEKAQNPNDASISVEIQTIENDIKQKEYTIKTKKLEISNLNKIVKNSVVNSEIDGVVQSVNDENTDTSIGMNSNEDADVYMTIVQVGQYKIKGTVNEQNIAMFMEGQKVIISSRIDDNQKWTGEITSIDRSNPEKSENQFMSAPIDSMTQSSKYAFYIKLDTQDNLMMGQHVYIEFDNGQESRENGLWIPSYFIQDENGEKFIWVAGSNNKLEKRKIEIGIVDENLLETQILNGLTKEDYIAGVQENLVEGMPVEKYDSLDELYENMESDMSMEENEYTDEIINDENIPDLTPDMTDLQNSEGDVQ